MRTAVPLVRRAGLALLIVGIIALATVAATQQVAMAAEAGRLAAPKNLNQVIDNIRVWLFGLLASLATLFFTIGGIRRLLAGGDPGEVAKANEALKNAAYGYGLAVLAPVLVTILKSFVGG